MKLSGRSTHESIENDQFEMVCNPLDGQESRCFSFHRIQRIYHTIILWYPKKLRISPSLELKHLYSKRIFTVGYLQYIEPVTIAENEYLV